MTRKRTAIRWPAFFTPFDVPRVAFIKGGRKIKPKQAVTPFYEKPMVVTPWFLDVSDGCPTRMVFQREDCAEAKDADYERAAEDAQRRADAAEGF